MKTIWNQSAKLTGEKFADGSTLEVRKTPDGRALWAVTFPGEAEPRRINVAPDHQRALERARNVVGSASEQRRRAAKVEEKGGGLSTRCNGRCGEYMPAADMEVCPHCGLAVCSACVTCSTGEAEALPSESLAALAEAKTTPDEVLVAARAALAADRAKGGGT